MSDGTEAGTFLLSDINPGPKDSSPRAITEVDGAIYFSAKTDRYGRELWKLGQPETSQAKNGGTNTTRDQEVELTRLVYDAAGKGRLRGKRNTSDEFIFSRENQFGAKRADQAGEQLGRRHDSTQRRSLPWLQTETLQGRQQPAKL